MPTQRESHLNRHNLRIDVDSNLLDHLNAIAKRVTKLDALDTGDGNAFEKLDAAAGQDATPVAEVRNGICQMRFGLGTINAILDPHMHALHADGQPEAASADKAFGLWDFR